MSTITSVKLAMGYVPAPMRTDTCANCAHGEAIYPDRMPPWDKPYFQCKKGGFRTGKMSVCQKLENKP